MLLMSQVHFLSVDLDISNCKQTFPEFVFSEAMLVSYMVP